ncbi:MAG: hypothetical protein KDD33_06480 [Bdellovibrionales bacterium]|nr:hypothetical protein [Bdellovibrionales bacterium]
MAEEQVKAETQAPDLPSWNCRVQGAPKSSQWTVGEVFEVECEGPSVVFSSSQLQTQIPEPASYSLKILKVLEQKEHKIVVQATSYNTGQHDFTGAVIAEDGVPKFKMEPLQVQVKSVLEQNKPDQKPFGPIMAMKLSYPWWLWLVLASFVVGGVFFALFRWKRKAQMKRVIDELKQHNTALGAYNQFNKDLRTLSRKNIFGKSGSWNEMQKERYVTNLDEIFRMYLLREFYIPALEWNSKLVLKEVSKNDKKGFAKYGEDLRGFLKELDHAKDDIEKVKVNDCQQLTQMARRTTQTIWQQRRN